MDKFICKVNGFEFPTLAEFNQHLRNLKIKQEAYYQQYEPRHDKLTGQLIPFKNRDQYFTSDFINKDNMQTWFRKNPKEAKPYVLELIVQRTERKNLKYIPTEVELRSTMMPSMHSIIDMFGGYNKVCECYGLIPRFKNEDKLPQVSLSKDSTIIVDTREQNPFKFPNHKTEYKKINCGDYSLGGKLDKGIYIERKSLNDFAGTLSGGLERFEREIERAKELGHYIIMVVENDISSSMIFNFLPNMKYCKSTPGHIFHNLRLLLEKHNNFQVVFCKNREFAAKCVLRIFALGDLAKQTDLQYRLEKGDFNNVD